MELIIIDLTKDQLDIEFLYNDLPVDIKARVDRYKQADDRKRSIIGWSIVHKKVDLTKNKITFNQNGKPYIDNNYFSISHSNNLVGILFDDKECGLDIEYITKRYEKLANKILNHQELEEYKTNSDILIEKWTKIEAYYKKVGTGIKFDSIKDLPKDLKIITKKMTDTLNNQYYYSICVKQ